MKKKKVWIVMFVFMLTYGVVFVSCASLMNFANPIHAINSDGEKVEAARGAGQTVRIGTEIYTFSNRPSVPSAPSAPQRPPHPGNPPLRPANPTGSTTFQNAAGSTFRITWSNIDELRQALRTIPNISANSFVRTNLQNHLNQAEQRIQEYNRNLSAYNARVTRFNQDMARFEQNMARFQQENATHQANLPVLRAIVEVQIRNIQDSIFPNAPGNWILYVEGKYLIYEGRLPR